MTGTNDIHEKKATSYYNNFKVIIGIFYLVLLAYISLLVFSKDKSKNARINCASNISYIYIFKIFFFKLKNIAQCT